MPDAGYLNSKSDLLDAGCRSFNSITAQLEDARDLKTDFLDAYAIFKIRDSKFEIKFAVRLRIF